MKIKRVEGEIDSMKKKRWRTKIQKAFFYQIVIDIGRQHLIGGEFKYIRHHSFRLTNISAPLKYM